MKKERQVTHTLKGDISPSRLLPKCTRILQSHSQCCTYFISSEWYTVQSTGLSAQQVAEKGKSSRSFSLILIRVLPPYLNVMSSEHSDSSVSQGFSKDSASEVIRNVRRIG